ncbi:MAG: type II toxin-antitoxin system HipA family toxin [Thalassobaculaceae bacterium]|nr:type II toxin-antitoxin system HipA family toxin [Thalassobaculaceae bacterium]
MTTGDAGPAPRRLTVRADGRRLGTLEQDSAGYLSFAHDAAWLRDPAFAISVRLPLRAEPYDHAMIDPFLAGLLPDLSSVREKIGRAFDVDGDNDFSLLSAIGRDAAGALSFTPETAPEPGPPTCEPLDLEALAARVATLPDAPLVVDEDGEIRYSLAGVNNKLALVETGDAAAPYGLPKGGAPSTHILKTDIPRLIGSAKVEHFCLRLARRVKLPAAETRLLPLPEADGRPAATVILIHRYDRIFATKDGAVNAIRRVHQEDFCQALGVLPRVKYEKDGGPNLAAMIAVIRAHSLRPAKDLPQFLDAVAFNVLVGNPDAHAKNYSLLHRRGGVRLAPLYDVFNAAAFRGFFKTQTPRIAQAIDGERDPNNVTVEHWRNFAAANGLAVPPLLARLRAVARAMTAALPDLLAEHMDDPVRRSDLLPLAADDIFRRCATLAAKAS